MRRAMRFPLADRLSLPCRFARYVQGQLHPDGRRYLPLLVLELPPPPAGNLTPAGLSLGVVDRHHVVDPALEGRSGRARLVFALSALLVQPEAGRAGLLPEAGLGPGRASTAPLALGRVAEVGAWEVERGHLAHEALYAELVIDLGVGLVGLRTSATAPSLAAALGREPIGPGDWVELRRSRVDILAFEAD